MNMRTAFGHKTFALTTSVIMGVSTWLSSVNIPDLAYKGNVVGIAHAGDKKGWGQPSHPPQQPQYGDQNIEGQFGDQNFNPKFKGDQRFKGTQYQDASPTAESDASIKDSGNSRSRSGVKDSGNSRSRSAGGNSGGQNTSYSSNSEFLAIDFPDAATIILPGSNIPCAGEDGWNLTVTALVNGSGGSGGGGRTTRDIQGVALPPELLGRPMIAYQMEHWNMLMEIYENNDLDKKDWEKLDCMFRTFFKDYIRLQVQQRLVQMGVQGNVAIAQIVAAANIVMRDLREKGMNMRLVLRHACGLDVEHAEHGPNGERSNPVLATIPSLKKNGDHELCLLYGQKMITFSFGGDDGGEPGYVTNFKDMLPNLAPLEAIDGLSDFNVGTSDQNNDGKHPFVSSPMGVRLPRTRALFGNQSTDGADKAGAGATNGSTGSDHQGKGQEDNSGWTFWGP